MEESSPCFSYSKYEVIIGVASELGNSILQELVSEKLSRCYCESGGHLEGVLERERDSAIKASCNYKVDGSVLEEVIVGTTDVSHSAEIVVLVLLGHSRKLDLPIGRDLDDLRHGELEFNDDPVFRAASDASPREPIF